MAVCAFCLHATSPLGAPRIFHHKKHHIYYHFSCVLGQREAFQSEKENVQPDHYKYFLSYLNELIDAAAFTESALEE